MKNKKIVKILTITLCLSAIFSTVVIAKENKQYRCAKASIHAVDPHPTEVEFPD